MKIQSMSKKPGRFVIVDVEGALVGDAQGYGYKTSRAANKAMWYKFGGGRQKIGDLEKRKKQFFRENAEIARFTDEFYETWCKEIARGDVRIQDLADEIQKKFSTTISTEYLR